MAPGRGFEPRLADSESSFSHWPLWNMCNPWIRGIDYFAKHRNSGGSARQGAERDFALFDDSEVSGK